MNERNRKLFIQTLLILPSEQVLYILKTLTKDQTQVIVEIIHNILKGVCPLSSIDKQVLHKYKNAIRNVVTPQLNLTQRKKQLLRIRTILPLFFKSYTKYVSRADSSS